jgi:hypothetical protein
LILQSKTNVNPCDLVQLSHLLSTLSSSRFSEIDAMRGIAPILTNWLPQPAVLNHMHAQLAPRDLRKHQPTIIHHGHRFVVDFVASGCFAELCFFVMTPSHEKILAQNDGLFVSFHHLSNQGRLLTGVPLYFFGCIQIIDFCYVLLKSRLHFMEGITGQLFWDISRAGCMTVP